ncbi:hypothetical protein [Methylorubrum salsuginis]|uniref:DDE superfamily endonuclease n=1 Tax=Methylorubrum salsuginis TaxID=414703 RepID=A0A1I4HBX2_9HYPH|nr:hypothetical protein [Methylorubrum salsuginis]SFL39087.1 hypothetical protein SAMN04488125_11422 [Methylorubrum salsuginis]
MLADERVALEGPPRLSPETIRRTSEKNRLKPHLRKMWCIPPEQSAAFVSHMEDGLDVYQRPADPCRPLVCLDETSLQLIGEVRPPRPVRRGRSARYDSEYVRHGTANLLLAFAPLSGQRVVAAAWQQRRNARGVDADWRFTTEDARIKLRKPTRQWRRDRILG